MARKSNAQKAAEAAAALAAEQAETQELAKVETVDGETVVTDLEPVSEGPVTTSVDADGEDLGDVTNQPVEAPETASEEAVDPTEEIVGDDAPSEAPEPEQESVITPELADILTHPALVDEITKQINDEIVADLIKTATAYELEDGFLPILRPTMVGDELTGHIPCPKAVFETVQIEGWQRLIDSHPAKHALKSIVYWKNINGSATVRCMSSSKFADVA